jgi:hypothetical protein
MKAFSSKSFGSPQKNEWRVANESLREARKMISRLRVNLFAACRAEEVMTDSGRDPQAHLDLLELDALRAGESLPAAARAHLAWCAECAAGLAELKDLQTALRMTPSAAPSPERDAALLANAGWHAARVRRARRRILPAAAAAAAVAVLAVAALLNWRAPQTTTVELASAPAARLRDADLDADGRITVLDAFALARADAAAAEVDAVLAQAVALENWQ